MPDIFKEDDWSMAEGQLDGQPLIVRSRSALPDEADRHVFDKLIIVSWSYTANDVGMPQDEDNQQTIQFEDAIDESLQDQDVGYLTGCITGNGKKEWRYYARDVDAFMSRFNLGLAGHPEYPLEIRVFQDPDWAGLSELFPNTEH
ncbi:hypothetical protein CEK29_01350 [Bordetella genomosp. 5]|uniref:DUF695 domain-containing protein n=1 Tax=Bordetella genomosp. 5 TaxID=1395608 RepID=A0A261U075_9BORD|nr:DUF695 domain-containing protein [Bordetella genomosp. 5]OZI47421.1 hypothetical protein CEK29_01350 [Bordetella genomosp. 5]OZI55354.1 hypothetical protein CAL25_02830 [Bordetella genomosp. 5]